MQETSPKNSSTASRVWSEIWDIIKFLAPIIIVVFLIRTYVAQPFIVDGESMAPNFHTGHYLIIDEISYHFHQPARGDVVVMRYPLDTSRFFIKRIIGLPGDTVLIKDGHVVITNPANPKGYVLTEPYETQATFPAGNYNNVTLKDGEYFALGDNRGGSSDSRTWGILPKKDIIGHVILRLFPISSAGIEPASLKSFEKPATN
ncbi:MAG: signal peptidase signal peptidase [Patescibacteria group bacterium]|nr:signal peptidase signal peptidase [Patescibacteria group bacterium]